MILIIDNESHFIKKLEEKLQEHNVEFKIFRHDEQIDLEKLPKIDGVVLSGGPGDPFTAGNVTTDFEVLHNLNVPTIGFCLGHEIIAVAHGGLVEDLPEKQNKMQHVTIDRKNDPIFNGISEEIYLREKHHRHVSRPPKDFVVLGHSDVCPVEIMRHENAMMYGFQSHPEKSGETGFKIMKNFLGMCGIRIE